MSTKDKKIIGRTTKITFVDAGIVNLPAKVDTGAYSSSIWATEITEKDGVLTYKLLGPSSPFYTGKTMKTKDYKITDIENSFGQQEDRFVVRLRIQINGRSTRATFTLANRGVKSYSALIGRRFLRDRYLVDVAHGDHKRKKPNWSK